MSEQAVKIFEALSGVDEELLERCDQRRKRKGGAVYRIYQKYGKTMAAGLCLMVVGAAAWGGYHLASGSSYGEDCSGLNGAVAEQAQMTQSMADGGVPGENGEGGPEAWETEQETASADMDRTESKPAPAAGAAASPEAEGQPVQDVQSQTGADKDVEKYTAPSDSSSGAGGGSHAGGETDRAEEMAQLRDLENALLDSRVEIPWGEACVTEPFSSYLPTVLPTGYEAFSARRSAFPEQWDNLIFKWTDGERIFYLDMTRGEVVTGEDIGRRDGLYEYVAEDFREEWIPDLPAGEPISFTLYYADGMRIDFNGYITADEMWEVVESINK